jgi:hypothetical protein
MPDSDPARRRKVQALRKKGWTGARIDRWLREQDVVAAREERIRPRNPWDNEKAVAAGRLKLAAKYGDDWEHDFHDPQTALAIVNDAEREGLVVQPSEFAYDNGHSLGVQIPNHYKWWEELSNDSYHRGGRPAVVRDSAQATRDVIEEGFPDRANRVNLYTG